MKKTAYTTTFTLALLASFLIGTQTSDVVQGNFVPTSPESFPPIISIISPTNKTYESKVLLHLNITAFAYYQKVNYVEYILDEQKHLVYDKETTDLNWSTTLGGLSEGIHSLKVTASCKSYYVTSTSGGALYYRIYGATSDVINFTVVYPPEISILSIENKTYNTNNIPLNFEVNEPVLKIEYCLDGQGNTPIDGNETLTGLTDGLHNVTIYAIDLDGHVGISETVYFVTDTFSTAIVVTAFAVSVAAIGAGLLLYFKKRKH